jgi:hypothetical protein
MRAFFCTVERFFLLHIRQIAVERAQTKQQNITKIDTFNLEIVKVMKISSNI